MKKITFSLISILSLSGLSFGGGNVVPIVPVEEPIVETPVNSAFYVGLGYSYLSSNRTAKLNKPGDPRHGQVVKDTDSNADNILLQVGYQFNPYLALEGRYTFSVGDHSLTHNHLGGIKEDVDIDISNMALYIKPMYPIGDFSIYGLLGYGKVERERHEEPYRSWDGSGFQWGAGVQYAIGDDFSVFVDYTRWYDEEGEPHERLPRLLDTDFSVLSVGISYRF
ncbi:porin family protein [Sulfurovum sp. NBC37-1]|uniref:porin family protein n=1 Tax=Sulfurovum sp. (strain NBC37-1) TaxID=387093 RepID=UPI000158756A|nr:porin family protein [Sulfurovum sp. NBC37-1]BAF71817.1 hypothetical protein SUN_0859 [Sulfurovum sp. NBC37-1]